jgi:hypothetical protein
MLAWTGLNHPNLEARYREYAAINEANRMRMFLDL